MEGRGAVEEHVVPADDLVEDLVRLFRLGVDHTAGGPDVVREFLRDEFLDDERFEEFERHLLRESALVELELRTDDDDGASGVVHALAEEVLAEPALLALQGVGEGPERAALSGRRGRGGLTPPCAVVEEGVDRLLEHALLVPRDDFRRAELHELLQAVVPVDDAAVKVIEVGRREAAAVEGDHRTEVRRDDRDRGREHPLKLELGLLESLEHFQSLERLLRIGDVSLREFLAERLDHRGDIHALEHLADRFRADAGRKDLPEFRREVEIFHFGEDLVRRERAELVLRGAILVLEFLEAFRIVLELLLLLLVFRVEVLEGLLLEVLLHFRHDVRREVDDLLELHRGDPEDESDLRGDTAEEPDMGDRRRELDVTHPLAADDRARHFDAALVADDPLIADALVLSAVAFPVLRGTEYLLAEETLRFVPLGAVVDRFRFRHFPVRPLEDLIRAREREPDGIEVADFGDVFHRRVLRLSIIGRRNSSLRPRPLPPPSSLP